MTLEHIRPYLTINKELEVTRIDHKGLAGSASTYLLANLSDTQARALREHFGASSLAEVVKRVIPLYVLPLMDGQITPEDFVLHMLKQDKRAKDIAGFFPDSELKDRLYKCYDKLIGEPVEAFITEDTSGRAIFMPPAPTLKVLDSVLEASGLPTFGTLYKKIEETYKFDSIKEALVADAKKAEAEAQDIKAKLAQALDDLAAKPYAAVEVVGDGTIPSGKIEMVEAKKVFPGIKSKMKVPVWQWDGVHPMVPAKNPDYIFREDILMRALYALVTNQRMYLQGHTGSGKTTLLEQIAAHLNYPFVRINFDSEITRMDLIGRDTLVQEDGTTTSKFVEGLLPQMMQQPCIGCFDEIDFCRPDVAYVMQSALENNSLRLTEDAGREIKPHPMFRMFATGNTVGQGDEHGMYQGARPQSLAFLDRFTVWAKVEYLSAKERLALIKANAPALADNIAETINKYTTEHLEGFTTGKILQPISPRGMIAVAKATAHLIGANPGNDMRGLREAMYMTILDRASTADYATLKGIVDRVTK